MFETYTNLAKLLGKGILVTGLTISNWFGVVPSDYFVPPTREIVYESSPVLGATFHTPDVRALFETSLATGISSSATSMTLVSGTDKDGNALASSTYAFIIDEGTSVEEFVLADCTGTACTNMSRGISVSTGTTTVSALQFAHRRGASVKITDATALIFATNVLKGKQNIENPLKYNSIATSTLAADRNSLASAGLVADTAFNGAGVIDATTLAKGVTQLATNLQVASSTSLGSSGASLVIPASVATSTYVSGNSLQVVVTQNNNKIDPNFLDLSSLGTATFTGTTTFSSTATSSTVVTATSSLKVGAFSVYKIGKNFVSYFNHGTYSITPPLGVRYLDVECVGAGGGGGGSNGSSAGGGGGGAGAYRRSTIDTNGTSSIAFTIGLGGPGGASSPTAGTAGTDTVFSSYFTAKGGSGGASSGTGTGGSGGATTTNTTGDFTVSGGDGASSGNGTSWGPGGIGGSSFFGGGGRGSVNAAGSAGQASGSGGGGAGNTSAVGGNGQDGACVIRW